MGNARVTLPEELHDLVRDVVADLESATDRLDLSNAQPAQRPPRRDRRRPVQATILRLPGPDQAAAAATAPPGSLGPPLPAAARPFSPPPAPPAFESSTPVPAAAPRRRAFLARLDVASTVPNVELPARTRRLQVACRRASPLDAARISRMLRVAVPAIPVAPATLASPPAWLLAAMAPPIPTPTPAVVTVAAPDPATVALAGRLASPPAPADAPEVAVVIPSVTPPLPVTLPSPLPPAIVEERPQLWRAAGGHVANLLIAAALGLVTIFCCIVVGLVVTGHHLEEVVTGSMQPTIPIGSLVVTENLPAGQLQVGDVLVFPDPNNTKLTIVHRIVWLSHDQSGDVLVRTKGDYNALPDSWTIKRSATAYADKVIEILPGAGTVAGYLQTIGFAGLILLIVGVIVYYGVRKVRQILNEDATDEEAVGVAELRR